MIRGSDGEGKDNLSKEVNVSRLEVWGILAIESEVRYDVGLEGDPQVA